LAVALRPLEKSAKEGALKRWDRLLAGRYVQPVENGSAAWRDLQRVTVSAIVDADDACQRPRMDRSLAGNPRWLQKARSVASSRHSQDGPMADSATG
jgi:hypothetical protein